MCVWIEEALDGSKATAEKLQRLLASATYFFNNACRAQALMHTYALHLLTFGPAGPASPRSPFPGGPWSPFSPYAKRRRRRGELLLFSCKKNKVSCRTADQS